MASRTGILSDAHSEKFCLEFNAAPLGYFQANYHELPANPSLPGIKTPRYVKTVNKPPLDVAAVNLGKLLHSNNHMAASFLLDRMAHSVTNYTPPHIPIFPPTAISTPIASINPNANRTNRGVQVAAAFSGISAATQTGEDEESRGASMSTPPPTAAASRANPDLFERTSMSGSLRQSERVRDEAAVSARRGQLATTPNSIASRIAQERLARSTGRSPHTGGSPGANTAQQNRRESVAAAQNAILFEQSDALFRSHDQGRAAFNQANPPPPPPPPELRRSERETRYNVTLIDQ